MARYLSPFAREDLVSRDKFAAVLSRVSPPILQINLVVSHGLPYFLALDATVFPSIPSTAFAYDHSRINLVTYLRTDGVDRLESAIARSVVSS